MNPRRAGSPPSPWPTGVAGSPSTTPAWRPTRSTRPSSKPPTTRDRKTRWRNPTRRRSGSPAWRRPAPPPRAPAAGARWSRGAGAPCRQPGAQRHSAIGGRRPDDPGRCRPASNARPGPLVAAGDVREAVREQRAGNLVILAVDASGSMGAETRMEAAKGAVLGLLLDAYQRRDRVALVTFRGDGADVALRPTGSIEVAKARLTDLPTGGRRLSPPASTPPWPWPSTRATGRCSSSSPMAGPPPTPTVRTPWWRSRRRRPKCAGARSPPWWSTPRTGPPASAWPPSWPRPWAPATSPVAPAQRRLSAPPRPIRLRSPPARRGQGQRNQDSNGKGPEPTEFRQTASSGRWYQ